jgi:hypothetical protein
MAVNQAFRLPLHLQLLRNTILPEQEVGLAKIGTNMAALEDGSLMEETCKACSKVDL